MNRFARLVTSVVSAERGLVVLTGPGGAVKEEPPAESWPPSADDSPLARSLCRRVTDSGRPLALVDSSTEPDGGAAGAGGDAEPAVAFAGVPLTGGSGEVIGVLCAVDAAPRAWTGKELRDLEDLAAACSAELRLRFSTDRAQVARRGAEEARHAAERATGRAEETAERMRTLLSRSQLLLRAAEDLAAASGLDEVRRRIGTLVGGDLKPAYVGLVLAEGRNLRRIAVPDSAAVPPGHPEEVYGVEEDWPTARAVRENRMVVVRDRVDLAAGYGTRAVAGFDSLGLTTVACVPLAGTRRVLGCLVLGWEVPHEIDVSERAVLTALAGYTAQAVERGLFLDDRVTVARQLQGAMLTELPVVPGLDLAALYRPAAVDDMVGGDWYDTYPLTDAPPDAAGVPRALTIGDIIGHDMRAATVMGQVRSMLRQADHDHTGEGPARAVRALEHACARVGLDAGGTLVHAHLTPEDAGHWLLEWTNAGHPPPLLAHPDGRIERLAAHNHLMHRGLPPLPRTDHRRVLAPGAVLLLYTDGLVEVPGGDIDAAIDRTARALGEAAAADVPLSRLLERLADGASAPGEHDDTVLLAVRVPRQAGRA
ncbi:GAF domain-containing SpoIIE family protein phosphatase [Streptomyces minutiscleroticus]|uniref:Uncharacterized protein n=1 Tax=Streptomyces minutiscleroticus TaxID=68238 RepID=A0A918NR58_9ACTN|nr:SpoIIE family protein phosphatase [Streptomyces minutiscleroticus]GGX89728.1 hypothetical protein GCM10010358_49600 [Streptomyces minutiscleroticus]